MHWSFSKLCTAYIHWLIFCSSAVDWSLRVSSLSDITAYTLQAVKKGTSQCGSTVFELSCLPSSISDVLALWPDKINYCRQRQGDGVYSCLVVMPTSTTTEGSYMSIILLRCCAGDSVVVWCVGWAVWDAFKNITAEFLAGLAARINVSEMNQNSVCWDENWDEWML